MIEVIVKFLLKFCSRLSCGIEKFSSLHQHICFFNCVFIFGFPSKEPSVGPDNVSSSKLNETTFNISWAPLTREESYGRVILYDIKEELLSRGKRRKRSISSRTLNITTTFVVLYDLSLCSQYYVSVRAYTKEGPGPYSQPMVLNTSSEYRQNIQT